MTETHLYLQCSCQDFETTKSTCTQRPFHILHALTLLTAHMGQLNDRRDHLPISTCTLTSVFMLIMLASCVKCPRTLKGTVISNSKLQNSKKCHISPLLMTLLKVETYIYSGHQQFCRIMLENQLLHQQMHCLKLQESQSNCPNSGNCLKAGIPASNSIYQPAATFKTLKHTYVCYRVVFNLETKLIKCDDFHIAI